MIEHQMPLLDPALLLRSKFPEHFTKMTASAYDYGYGNSCWQTRWVWTGYGWQLQCVS